MSELDNSVFADNGEYLGEQVPIDGGGFALISPGGEILSAVDERMEPVDLGDLEYEAPAQDPADDLRQEIAALRQDIENAPPAAPMHYELPEARDQRWATGVGRELDNVEQMLGRPLTDAETHRVLADHKADFDAGVGADAFKSATVAGLTPFAPGRDDAPGVDRGEARRAFMAEALGDAQREQAGEDYDPREPWVMPASTDPGDVRRAAITNAAHGHETDEEGID